MDKLILLIGKSGSGKTTVARRLEDLGYNVIQSYTTRPPRYENEWGHTFIGKRSVTIKKLNGGLESIWTEESGLITIDDMIAYKVLYGFDYFATNSQVEGKGTSIYIVDPISAMEIKKEDPKACIMLLDVSDGIRRNRMLKDGRCKRDIELRLKEDVDIFKDLKYDIKINANNDVDTVLDKILEVI